MGNHTCKFRGGCYCGCYLCKYAPEKKAGPMEHCESHVSGCHVSCP